ncbi:hypothetical protein GYB22_02525 [bacterium]|nr:hypothetical protein [bacterium]
MNHVISLQFNLKELSVMKSFIEVLSGFFLQMEYKITEFISSVMFGETAVKEYEDLKLPSEDRPETEVKLKPKARLKRKRNLQLHLMFLSAMKKALLKMIIGIESGTTMLGTILRKKENSFENTYR